MLVCSNCGAENREGASFCDSCGTPLAVAPMREVRKVVTVLFCDVTGSTALGERIDPESLRRVLARYFETAKEIVERHGGSVEKFIGDAVMAVFGVPAVHEDDALRAVRAADELRTGLGELNEELERSYGTRLELRMGVNTGEVVAGTEERLATGDAVNVAARLEQAAGPGEILLGEETYALVRGSVVAEPAASVEAKGKAEPLRAHRLLSVHARAPRRHDVPMVGRERQRNLLADAFSAVTEEEACHLFTILGPAGVGKTRLTEEFLGGLEATVVRGRCLSYGEGISYWPVTEVVKQLQPDEEVTGPLVSVVRDSAEPSSPEEIAWAFRKLLEAHAARQPVVVVFDDVHWGEPVFLDLVEHVADLSRGAPILLLCMARPELLDRRPAWGGGKLNATNALLEPLAPEEAGTLIAELDAQISPVVRERILEAAGGNPLFVEEMVAMAASDDRAEIAMPPSIHALLAARLDQLEPAERGVLERAAVEGQVFHRGAVVALGPEEPEVDGRLVALVRKDLVRPEQAVLVDEEAYRFRHLLIRDTAYDALPKAVRAELHERFAVWLEEHGADLVEQDEIVGYHLEQAYGYRTELGPLDSTAAAIAERAAGRLSRSAERARQRGDLQSAKVLLGRVAELLPEQAPERRRALASRAYVLADLGELEASSSLLEEAASAAHAAADEALLPRLQLLRIELASQLDPAAMLRDSLAQAEAAHAELERFGDESGAVTALRLIGNFQAWLGNSRAAERTWTSALGRAERVDSRIRDEILQWLLWLFWFGFEPVDEGLRRCDEIRGRAQRSGAKGLEGVALAIRGSLHAYRGRFDEGRADVAAGRALLHELGAEGWWAGTSMIAGEIELVAGDHQAAYDFLAGGARTYFQQASSGYLSSILALQAQAALGLGREDEALGLADQTNRMAQKDDLEPLVRVRMLSARIYARRGDSRRADELLDAAAALLESTDFLSLHVELGLARAEVARLGGRADDERSALDAALAAAEQKGYSVAVDEIHERLAEL